MPGGPLRHRNAGPEEAPQVRKQAELLERSRLLVDGELARRPVGSHGDALDQRHLRHQPPGLSRAARDPLSQGVHQLMPEDGMRRGSTLVWIWRSRVW